MIGVGIPSQIFLGKNGGVDGMLQNIYQISRSYKLPSLKQNAFSPQKMDDWGNIQKTIYWTLLGPWNAYFQGRTDAMLVFGGPGYRSSFEKNPT